MQTYKDINMPIEQYYKHGKEIIEYLDLLNGNFISLKDVKPYALVFDGSPMPRLQFFNTRKEVVDYFENFVLNGNLFGMTYVEKDGRVYMKSGDSLMKLDYVSKEEMMHCFTNSLRVKAGEGNYYMSDRIVHAGVKSLDSDDSNWYYSYNEFVHSDFYPNPDAVAKSFYFRDFVEKSAVDDMMINY